MENKELHQYAHNLAEMSLEKGFNENAYILKVLSEMALRQKGMDNDLIPESNVDDMIDNLMNAFLGYFYSKEADSLKNVMNIIVSIVSEMYHSCETKEEQYIVTEAIKSIAAVK